MSADTVRVRLVQGDDIEKILEIENSSFIRTWDADRLRRLAYGSFSGVLVATDETGGVETVCGFLAWRVRARLFHIQTIAVDPQFRGRGVGHRLIECAMELARDGGSERLYLEVRVSNAKAIHLYESFGFAVEKKIPRYYKTEDALRMIKSLT